jgi:hypothetical protein
VKPFEAVYIEVKGEIIMQAIIKRLSVLLSLTLCLGSAWNNTAMAQSGGETEAATESHLLQVMLPANAQRVRPESVPAEITQTLAKVTAAGGGKFQQGDSEVLLWAGPNYKKANASGVVNNLTGSMKTAGWKYTIAAEENGVTVFGAVKESPRRAVIGFYGATDEALIVAVMEVFSNSAAGTTNGQTTAGNSDQEMEKPAAPQNSSASGIVGTWTNGTMGMMGEKYRDGTVAARRGTSFKYVFHPNGSFEFTGYGESTMFGCVTSLFQDKRGTYQISGSQITLTLNKNLWRNQYSCSPASNKERNYTLGTETYNMRTKTDEYGKTLVCLANGQGESCYRRED